MRVSSTGRGEGWWDPGIRSGLSLGCRFGLATPSSSEDDDATVTTWLWTCLSLVTSWQISGATSWHFLKCAFIDVTFPQIGLKPLLLSSERWVKLASITVVVENVSVSCCTSSQSRQLTTYHHCEFALQFDKKELSQWQGPQCQQSGATPSRIQGTSDTKQPSETCPPCRELPPYSRNDPTTGSWVASVTLGGTMLCRQASTTTFLLLTTSLGSDTWQW